MQNAMNNDKIEKQWNKAKGSLDAVVSEASDVDTSDLRSVASDYATKARELSSEYTAKARDISKGFYDDSVGFVKRYPVSTALGLAAVGFAIGALTARKK